MLPTLAVIGVGFSGTIIAYELVHQANNPAQILLFDSSNYAGKGIAFSTLCPSHLLNVTVQKMSALHNNTNHLLNWLEEKPQAWRKLDPSFATLEIHKDLFLPRMIYGAYLQHIRELTERMAKVKHIKLQYVKEDVVDIGVDSPTSLVITSLSGKCYSVQAAIIATGIPWTRPLSSSKSLRENSNYLDAPWPTLTNPRTTQEWLKNTTSVSTIGMIGSGLTMLDAVASLDKVGYRGKIKVISKHGLLPQAHDLTLTPIPPFAKANEFPNSPVQIYNKLRKLASGVDKNLGIDWRTLIEFLRPITSTLWKRFSLKEKLRVLRHLFSHWNRYRHKSPQETLQIIHRYINENQLEIIKANASKLEPEEDGRIGISMVETETQKPFKAIFDKVINCTGPNFDIKRNTNQLLVNVLAKGIAECDDLGLGLKVDTHCQLISKNKQPPCFAIGSLLFGTLFETVAVPELRKQAHGIATKVLKELSV